MRLSFFTLFFLLIAFSASTQSIKVEYSLLKTAYENYDTTFFNSLVGKEVDIIHKGKYLRRGRPGSGIVPYIDWFLNKKARFVEYDFHIKDSLISITIDDHYRNVKTIYVFKIIGDKPQIVFKKCKRNWYKVKRLKNCLLIEHEKEILYPSSN